MLIEPGTGARNYRELACHISNYDVNPITAISDPPNQQPSLSHDLDFRKSTGDRWPGAKSQLIAFYRVTGAANRVDELVEFAECVTRLDPVATGELQVHLITVKQVNLYGEFGRRPISRVLYLIVKR